MKQFLLSWDAPSNSVVDDYIIEYSLHDEDWKIYNDGISTQTSGFVSGLDDCSFYRFRVASSNSVGTGLYSNVVSGMVLGSPPSTPINLVAITGDRKLDLYWDPPQEDGRCFIKDYIIEYYKNNEESVYVNTEGTDNKYILFNLINNNPYSIRVAAINSVGTGLFSNMITGLVPISKPSPITTFYAYPETDQLIGLTWEEPKTDLTEYIIEYSINGSNWIVIDRLPSGTTYYQSSDIYNTTSYFYRISSLNKSLQSIHNQQPFTYETPFDNLHNKTRVVLRMGDLL
jgi:hypothetical protein